jgi:hypothetical protein
VQFDAIAIEIADYFALVSFMELGTMRTSPR